MEANDFGLYLRDVRKKKKLTMRQLDKYSGVSHSYISQIERGERGIPSPDILKKIAKPLGVEYEELMEIAGYFTKEDILKGALPNAKFSINLEDPEQRDIYEKMFMELKNNPEKFLSSLSDSNRNIMVETMVEIMKESRPDAINAITNDFISQREIQARQIFQEASELSDEKLNQVADFIQFLKSKEK